MEFATLEKMLISVVAAIVHHMDYFKNNKFLEFFNMLDEAVDGFVEHVQEFNDSEFFQEYTKIAMIVYSNKYSENVTKSKLLELCKKFEESIDYPDPE